MKKENRIPLSLNIWKWWHIVYLCGIVLFFSWVLIFHFEAVARVMTRQSSLTILSMVINIVLSLLIIWGVIKRYKIGFFASLFYLLEIAVRGKIYNLESTLIGNIIILLALAVAFFIFKNSEYFGINIVKK